MNEEDGRKESKVVIKVKKGTSKGLTKLALENMLVNRVVRFARRNGANAGALVVFLCPFFASVPMSSNKILNMNMIHNHAGTYYHYWLADREFLPFCRIFPPLQKVYDVHRCDIPHGRLSEANVLSLENGILLLRNGSLGWFQWFHWVQ